MLKFSDKREYLCSDHFRVINQDLKSVLTIEEKAKDIFQVVIKSGPNTTETFAIPSIDQANPELFLNQFIGENNFYGIDLHSSAHNQSILNFIAHISGKAPNGKIANYWQQVTNNEFNSYLNEIYMEIYKDISGFKKEFVDVIKDSGFRYTQAEIFRRVLSQMNSSQ